MGIASCGRCGSPFGYSCMCGVQNSARAQAAAADAAARAQAAEYERIRRAAAFRHSNQDDVIDGECEQVTDFELPAPSKED